MKGLIFLEVQVHRRNCFECQIGASKKLGSFRGVPIMKMQVPGGMFAIHLKKHACGGGSPGLLRKS